MYEEFLKTVDDSDYWLMYNKYIRETKYSEKDGSIKSYIHELHEFIEENKDHPILELIREHKDI